MLSAAGACGGEGGVTFENDGESESRERWRDRGTEGWMEGGRERAVVCIERCRLSP